MPNYPAYGTPYYATATGTFAVANVNAQVVGILFAGTGTGQAQLFVGSTVSASLTPMITAYTTVTGATVNPAVYVPVPCYASGGFTLKVNPSADPKVMIFWNPA